MVRTHDEAAAVIRGESDRLGFRYVIEDVRSGEPGFRRYSAVLERFGRRPIAQTSVYGLPMSATALAAHMQQMVKDAALAAAKEKR